jgi:phosphoribosyl 1,2-cyclic phosphodiesterase
MKFCSLYSGSSGNSLFVSHKDTNVLIDAGVSGVKISRSLHKIEEEGADLDALLITHEHRDHIMGAGIISRRFDLPIYANEKTWQAMSKDLGKIASHNQCVFSNDQPFEIKDLYFQSFSVYHDAAAPVGFYCSDGDKKMSFLTDTGTVSEEIFNLIHDSDFVYLESNHDIHMLEAGPYPYYLKQRIRSDLGHLSNSLASKVALKLFASKTRKIILGHLSEENNHPDVAFQTTFALLQSSGSGVDAECIEVAPRYQPSTMIDL